MLLANFNHNPVRYFLYISYLEQWILLHRIIGAMCLVYATMLYQFIWTSSMLFLLLKWKLNYWAALHVQDKNSEKMQSGRGFWFEILINNLPNLNVVYGLYVDVSAYYWFCYSRNFWLTLATKYDRLLPVFIPCVSTGCITFDYHPNQLL